MFAPLQVTNNLLLFLAGGPLYRKNMIPQTTLFTFLKVIKKKLNNIENQNFYRTRHVPTQITFLETTPPLELYYVLQVVLKKGNLYQICLRAQSETADGYP